MSTRVKRRSPSNPIAGAVWGSFGFVVLSLAVIGGTYFIVNHKKISLNNEVERAAAFAHQTEDDQAAFNRVKKEIEERQRNRAASEENVAKAKPFSQQMNEAWRGGASENSLEFNFATQLTHCLTSPLPEEDKTLKLKFAQKTNPETYALQKVVICETGFTISMSALPADQYQALKKVIKNRETSFPLNVSE